jgi:hypothetical protein
MKHKSRFKNPYRKEKEIKKNKRFYEKPLN